MYPRNSDVIIIYISLCQCFTSTNTRWNSYCPSILHSPLYSCEKKSSRILCSGVTSVSVDQICFSDLQIVQFDRMSFSRCIDLFQCVARRRNSCAYLHYRVWQLVIAILEERIEIFWEKHSRHIKWIVFKFIFDVHWNPTTRPFYRLISSRIAVVVNYINM